MKKIFLILVILSAKASAQQKDLFDIDKHIQKSLQEKRKIANTDKIPYSFGKTHSFPGSYFVNDPARTFTLANGDKVVTLPFDNMPCIVTDMSQFQVMPNFGRGNPVYNFNFLSNKIPGAIPNGALLYKIVVAD